MYISVLTFTVRLRSYSDGSYIWINEVVNYSGGDNYAFRRVHPNLPETEGMYLSTNTQDIKGNFPYLAELEGIKSHGEVYLNYYFKRFDSDEITEKISFAKLYSDYNWILAMGVHLDDIDAYVIDVNNKLNSLTSEAVIGVLRNILLVMLAGFTVIYVLERKRFLSTTRELNEEINIDSLTKAYSRRSGEVNLSNQLLDFHKTKQSPAIMLFDIDGFKHINDTFGHAAGDYVLKEVVHAIQGLIRTSDRLYRWGGDEFVGVLPGLPQNHIMTFSNILLSTVSSIPLEYNGNKLTVTISIGFTYFKEGDSDFCDAIKRADDAMYISKQEGKNRATMNV